MSDHTAIDATGQTPTAGVTIDRDGHCNVYRAETVDARSLGNTRRRLELVSATSEGTACAPPMTAH